MKSLSPLRPEGINYFDMPNLKGMTQKDKVKVKFNLKQATKAQRWSRGIALLFL